MSLTLGALLGFSGNMYAEEIPLKQKAESVVKYLQRQPVNTFFGTRHGHLITKKGYIEFTYGNNDGNNELQIAVPYSENDERKIVTFVDEEKNGYGNVDAINAGDGWVIPTRKQEEIATKVYSAIIDKYLGSLEKNGENLERVLEKIAE